MKSKSSNARRQQEYRSRLRSKKMQEIMKEIEKLHKRYARLCNTQYGQWSPYSYMKKEK